MSKHRQDLTISKVTKKIFSFMPLVGSFLGAAVVMSFWLIDNIVIIFVLGIVAACIGMALITVSWKLEEYLDVFVVEKQSTRHDIKKARGLFSAGRWDL